MIAFNISADKLAIEKEIKTYVGITLYHDYYNFVVSSPIETWNNTPKILYGENDNVVDRSTLESFVNRFKGSLDILKNDEHYFNNEEQRYYFKDWVRRQI